jgi:sugar phosphate isomerase/epimerase
MKRREFLATTGIAIAASRQSSAARAALVPCINQVNTLNAYFAAELTAYHDAGFRHVELWFAKLQSLNLTPQAILSRLRDHDLLPVSACAAGNFLWRGVPGPAERRAELEDAFTLAQALGVPRFVVYDSVDATPAKDDYAVAAERLVALADLAAPFKVRIALEFIARSRLLGSLASTLTVMRKAAHPNVGVCLDTFHLFAGVSKLEDLDQLRPGDVEHVHFHDVPGSVPRELLADTDRTPPGTGVIPLARVVAALRRINYTGVLSVELFDPSVQSADPGVTARTCFAAVSRFAPPV